MISAAMAMFALGQAMASPLLNIQDANDFQDPGFAKVAWSDSPNFNKRPNDAVVDTVIIHSTVSPTLKGTVKWFGMPSAQVSAHFTIGKDGSIAQMVSTFDRAWHAGASTDHRGKSNLNNFTIGIELVNLNDGKDPYPKEQVRSLRYLLKSLARRHPIKFLMSHEFIAEPQGRKSDPKAFPWDDLKDLGFQMLYGFKPKAPGTP